MTTISKVHKFLGTQLHSKCHFTHKTAGPRPLHFNHSHWWKRRSWSKFASHYTWGTNKNKWMRDGCKIYMDSYMASNGSGFMVTWTIFKNHLLEVGLTQFQETMALWNRTTIDLSHFIMCEDLGWIEIHWNCIRLRAWSHIYDLRSRDHTTWFWKCFETTFGHFLLAQLLARVWSGPLS
jgi:hypothetical protein